MKRATRQPFLRFPAKRTGNSQSSRNPVRWDSLDHEQLGFEAEQTLLLGSPARAGQDAAFYVAKRRLRVKDPVAHLAYSRIKCADLVERLRAVRDVYRQHLEALGCRPLDEMHWVVFRFGVLHWAVRYLRSSVRSYIALTGLRCDEWDDLFGSSMPLDENDPGDAILQDGPELEARVNLRLQTSVFDQILVGGPFGREAQVYVAQEMMGASFMRGETFPETVKRRERLWDQSSSGQSAWLACSMRFRKS